MNPNLFDFDENLLLMSDSYKISQPGQYPPNSTRVISYLESRGGEFNNTVFDGLNYLLKKYLVGQVVTMEKIDDAEQFWNAHFGKKVFPRHLWEYIVTAYKGVLPVRIKAVREGSVVGTRNVLMIIENLDPKCWWLTNFLETLLVEVWYPTTVATLSREIKKVFFKYFKHATTYSDAEIMNIIQFMLHDFGVRGASSPQSAAWGGAAHLLNFLGTDNAMAIRLAQKWYNTTAMLGFSVCASEHSTITSWEKEHEIDAYRNMLKLYPNGTFACVSDSYDIVNATDKMWMGELLPDVLKRDGRLVIRLDSGSAKVTIKNIFEIIWNKAGGKVNDKGFRVMNDKIRILQGDGVNYHSIIDILDMMIAEKISPENIVFGMGGALLQKVDRDTQKFAFKCCALLKQTEAGEVMVDVVKSPIEFDELGNRVVSFKTSKKGFQKLIKNAEALTERDLYYTISNHDADFDSAFDELVTVFELGQMVTDYTFEEKRERAKIIPNYADGKEGFEADGVNVKALELAV